MAIPLRKRVIEDSPPAQESPEQKAALRSIKDAGRYLGGVSRNTILRAVLAKDLEAIKLGRRTMITVASLDRFVANLPRAEIRNA